MHQLLLAMLVTMLAPAQDQEFLDKPLARWIEDLGSRDPAVRRSAAYALGKFTTKAIDAVPRLERALRDKDNGVRAAAANALGEIGPTGLDDPVRSLLPLLGTQEADTHVRRNAAIAIGKLVKQGLADEAVAGQIRTGLEKALSDSEAPVRQNAAWASADLALSSGRRPRPNSP